MRILGAEVFEIEKGFVRRSICTDGEVISVSSGDGKIMDAEGCFLIPGLTDIHFHGCMGEDFSDGSPEGLQIIADYELSRGITQICPACITSPESALIKMCENAAQFKSKSKSGAELVGIHLEGPFLSAAKKGAQEASWLRTPDKALFDRLQGASQGLIKQVSIAPELPGAMDFIREASKSVLVSLAHTEADYETSLAALNAGARKITHLYNAMPPFLHRAPGVIGAAFDFLECRAELICDGIHIHPSAVRAAFHMFGEHRIILISDTMRAAGMPDGEYTLGGQEVQVRGKAATLKDGTLAGSVTDLMGCLRMAVSMGISLSAAVTAAAVNPAKALGIYSYTGSLENGKYANMVLLDENLSIKAVIFKGKIVENGKYFH